MHSQSDVDSCTSNLCSWNHAAHEVCGIPIIEVKPAYLIGIKFHGQGSHKRLTSDSSCEQPPIKLFAKGHHRHQQFCPIILVHCLMNQVVSVVHRPLFPINLLHYLAHPLHCLVFNISFQSVIVIIIQSVIVIIIQSVIIIIIQSVIVIIIQSVS